MGTRIETRRALNRRCPPRPSSAGSSASEATSIRPPLLPPRRARPELPQEAHRPGHDVAGFRRGAFEDGLEAPLDGPFRASLEAYRRFAGDPVAGGKTERLEAAPEVHGDPPPASLLP